MQHKDLNGAFPISLVAADEGRGHPHTPRRQTYPGMQGYGQAARNGPYRGHPSGRTGQPKASDVMLGEPMPTCDMFASPPC